MLLASSLRTNDLSDSDSSVEGSSSTSRSASKTPGSCCSASVGSASSSINDNDLKRINFTIKPLLSRDQVDASSKEKARNPKRSMEEIAIRLQSLWRGTRCRLQFASSNGYTPIHDLCAPNERREVKLCRFKGRLRVVKVYHTRTLKRTKRLLCTVSRSGRKAKIKQSNMLQVLQEIAIMKKLAHPYIVRLHEVIGDESGTALILVLQYVEGGQLMTWNDRQRRYLPNPRSRPVEVKIGRRAMGLGAIATNHHGRRRSTRAQKGLEKRWRLKQAVIQRYVLHVARGLEYLHSCGIVHRDLKPENLLLTSDGQRCLITDFGVATLVQRRGDRIRSSQRIPGYSSKPCPTPKRPEGTAAFFPPECATLDEPSQALDDAGEAGLVNRKTDPAAQDIWGLGVVLYCMICGRLPFWCPGDTIIDMVRRITEDDYVLTEEYPTGAEESDSDQSFRVDNDITSSDEDSSEEDEVWLQSFKTRRDADKSGDSRGGPGIGSSAGAPAHGWVEDGTQGSFPGKFRNREKTQGNGQETDKSDQSTGRRRPTKRSQWRDKVQASEEDTDEEDDRWLQSFKSCRGDSKKDDCEAIRLKPADQARFTNDDRRKLATLDHRILAVKDHDHSSYRGTANGEIRACGGRRTWSGSGINNDRGAGDRSGDAEELEARLATRKAGKAKEFATNGAPADSTFTPTKLTESVRGDSSQRHHGSGTVTSNIGEDVGGADLCAEEGLGRSKVEGDALEVCTECRDLLAQLLQKRPSKRYSARDALAHPWLRSAILTNTATATAIPAAVPAAATAAAAHGAHSSISSQTPQSKPSSPSQPVVIGTGDRGVSIGPAEVQQAVTIQRYTSKFILLTRLSVRSRQLRRQYSSKGHKW